MRKYFCDNGGDNGRDNGGDSSCDNGGDSRARVIMAETLGLGRKKGEEERARYIRRVFAKFRNFKVRISCWTIKYEKFYVENAFQRAQLAKN